MYARNHPISFLMDFSNKANVFNSLATAGAIVPLSEAKNFFNDFND